MFVHGSLSDLTIWELQLAPVGERHRAIVYSRRYKRQLHTYRSQSGSDAKTGNGASR